MSGVEPATSRRRLWFDGDTMSWRGYTPWSNKKQDTKLLSITSPNNDRFSKFFHCYTQQEIIITDQPHLNGVAALPCEILMSDNTPTVPCMLGHCFLKYKLARDMTYDTQQLLWQKQVTIIGSINLGSHINEYRTWCSPISACRLSPSLCTKTAFCSNVIIPCCTRCLQSVIQRIFQCSYCE